MCDKKSAQGHSRNFLNFPQLAQERSHPSADMNTMINSSAPSYSFRGVLLRDDSTTRLLASVSASNQDTPVLEASATESRSHQQFDGSSTHPTLNVLLSQPEANDADQSLYFQVELGPSSSGHVAFVFGTSEGEVTVQPELDWETLVLESVPKLSATDRQDLFVMLKQQPPNSLTQQLIRACDGIEKQHNTTTSSEATGQTGLVFVAADDNRIIRVLTKKQYKAIGSHPDSLILGATFEEAKAAPARVMALANKHGHHRVVALFDQNLDDYAEGSVFGSEMSQQLREQGFRGLICIRTSNNPEHNHELLKIGADLVVGKSLKEWPFSRVMETITSMLDSISRTAEE